MNKNKHIQMSCLSDSLNVTGKNIALASLESTMLKTLQNKLLTYNNNFK